MTAEREMEIKKRFLEFAQKHHINNGDLLFDLSNYLKDYESNATTLELYRIYDYVVEKMHM